MIYRLHRGAELDLLEAARFYRREGGAKLASRFLDEFHRVVNLLVEFPGLGTPADEVRRIQPLQGFPQFRHLPGSKGRDTCSRRQKPVPRSRPRRIAVLGAA